MSANSIALDLDISTLEPKKVQALAIFEELFAKLSQYKSQGVVPISITGLTEFNASISTTNTLLATLNANIAILSSLQSRNAASSISSATANNSLNSTIVSNNVETTKNTTAQTQNTAAKNQSIISSQKEAQIIKQLTNEMLLFNQALKDNEVRYANFVLNGQRNTPEAQLLLSQIKDQKKISGGIDRDLDNNNSVFRNLGKEFTGAYSALRNIAYILPGIGIAGIFNVALEAVSKVVDALVDVGTNLKQIDKDSAQFGLDSLNDLKKLQYEFNNYISELQLAQVIYDKFDEQRFGKNIVTDLDNATASVITFSREIDKYPDKIKDLTEKTNAAFQNFQNIMESNKEPLGGLFGGKSDNEKLAGFNNNIELALPSLTQDAQDAYKVYQTLLDAKFAADKEYEDKNNQLEIKQANLRVQEVQVANAEALALEKAQTEQLISERESRIKRLLALEINSESEQLYLINQNYQEQLKQNKLQNDLVHNDINSTFNDKKVADILFETANDVALENKRKEEKAKQDEFDKRKINAVFEYNNLVQTEIAKNNADINKNEDGALQVRLDALRKNLTARQQIIQDEYDKEIALSKIVYKTPEEKKNIEEKRTTGLANIESEAIDKIKQTVDSYGSNLISGIKLDDSSIGARQDDVTSYANAIGRLNNALIDGKISLDKFIEAKKLLNYSFTIDQDTKNIQDDLDLIDSYKEKLSNELVPEIKKASEELSSAQSTGNAQATSEAQQKLNGLLKLQKKINSDLKTLNNKEADDEKTLQEDRIKLTEDVDKIIAENKKAIFINLMKTLDELVAGYYQADEDRIQRNIELQDEYFSNELQGIEKSSLSQRDKIAFEKEITAQKQAADKEAAKEIRKDKHNEAVFDKQAAAAEVIYNTSVAVMKANATLPFPLSEAVAISYLALGATQLALVEAKPIPAYKFGTKGTAKSEYALYGEDGAERVTIPGKSSFIADKPTISFLPAGTEIIPINGTPNIRDNSSKQQDGWAQIKWLANQINGNKKQSKTTFVNNIDLGFELYKHKKIYG